ncbi:hypothetical protein BZG36_01612 [Bifiguratus adelaidae]|uniref:CSC1/OSCA1-like 7TM region domain-containing protein n=1 Tax=Bifiguratus adelaidae TaxID=1938954 RepID=A0A261Y4Q0_9FUNG|nr:hypothetical protein BZG36_01612 [Bifiguratus adelaidae]
MSDNNNNNNSPSSSSSSHSSPSNDASISSFVSSLVFNIAIAVILYVAIEILRRYFKNVYEPRTIYPEEERRAPPPPKEPFAWIPAVLRTKDEVIIQCAGLDAYVFLRFLRVCAVITAIFMVLGLAILFPVYKTGSGGNAELAAYTIGNAVGNRLWAAVIMSITFSAIPMYFIFREMRKYISLHQDYLISARHRKSVAANTTLITGIPKEDNNTERLREIFDKFPGGVNRIWLNRHGQDVASLQKLVDKRTKIVNKLEGAYSNYILKGSKYLSKKGGTDVPEKFRPMHNEGPLPIPLPCVTQKVDSISTYRTQIRELNQQVAERQNDQKSFKQHNSAFVEFHQQIASHLAAESMIHHKPFTMAPRYAEVDPKDVIWANLNIRPWEILFRRIIVALITAAIVILWAIPVAFVSAIAQLSTLTSLLPFLKVINNFPPAAIGIIQGVLPAIALAVLVALVPIIFNLLSRFEGYTTWSSVYLASMDKYFAFLVVNVLLVSTIAGGVFTTLAQLFNNPTSAVNILGTKLPQQSTFFITYVILAALTGAAMTMLNIVGLLLNQVLAFLKSTPRSIYNFRRRMTTLTYATMFPQVAIFFVLAMVYCTIAPLILPFTFLYFVVLYIVYCYLFLYVYDNTIETGGAAYPKVLRYMFIGIIIHEITLIGLFFLKGATGEGVLEIILLVATCFMMLFMDNSYLDHTKRLPIDLADAEEGDYNAEHRRSNATTTADEEQSDKVMAKPIEHPKTPSDLEAQTQGAGRPDVQFDGKRPGYGNGSAEKSLGDMGATEANGPNFYDIDTSAADDTRGDRPHIAHDRDDPNLAYSSTALKANQPCVWLPQDAFGIARKEVDTLNSEGIIASCHGVEAFNKKPGKASVRIDGSRYIANDAGIPFEGDEEGDICCEKY